MAPEMNSAMALANKIAEVRGDFIKKDPISMTVATVNHKNT